MSTDDIICDIETAFVKKGETYLFSDSYLALKHYDIKLSNIENNKKNKKFCLHDRNIRNNRKYNFLM